MERAAQSGADDAVPALLAGNGVIIKPSEVTPLAVRRAMAAMARALPDGILQVLIGAGETGAALVDQRRHDLRHRLAAPPDGG